MVWLPAQQKVEAQGLWVGSLSWVLAISSRALLCPSFQLTSITKHGPWPWELTTWCWEEFEWQVLHFFKAKSHVVVLVVNTTFLVCMCFVCVCLEEFRAILNAADPVWLGWIFLCLGKFEFGPCWVRNRGRGSCGWVSTCICSLAFLSPRLPAVGISCSF